MGGNCGILTIDNLCCFLNRKRGICGRRTWPHLQRSSWQRIGLNSLPNSDSLNGKIQNILELQMHIQLLSSYTSSWFKIHRWVERLNTLLTKENNIQGPDYFQANGGDLNQNLWMFISSVNQKEYSCQGLVLFFLQYMWQNITEFIGPCGGAQSSGPSNYV